jgi:hypothetical protein
LDINLEIAEITNAIIWPILIGILILKYGKQIRSFLKEITPRINKFSVGPVSLELAETKGFEPKWAGRGLTDDVSLTNISGSYLPILLNEMLEQTPMDYAIFDIGNGNQWLTSRLFIFTIMLHRTRALKRIVFVDTHNQIRRHFVGIAEPTHVRFALSTRYPWLEKAFAEECAKFSPNITSKNGAMEQYGTENLIREFFINPNIQQPIPPPGQEKKWVKLKDSNAWEHAEFLDIGKLEDILKDILDRSWISKTDLKGKSNQEQIIMILYMKKPFVAIVDEDRRFEKLVDREKLTQEILEQVLKE